MIGNGLESSGVALGQQLEGAPYRPTKLLARGESASVFRGEHVLLRSPVVLKVLHTTVSAAPELADRMRLEAQALARLTHPNLVPVTDSGMVHGHPFFVMDDDGGVPLSEVLGAHGRMRPDDAVSVASDVLEGLAFVHDSGLVHRNVHANNLLVSTGADGRRTVRLLDLGVAKLLGGRDVHGLAPLAVPTAEGAVLGTPECMAPEQVRGEAVDGRTDLYAVACLLYRLLTGRGPFAHHASAGKQMAAHVSEAVTEPRDVGAALGQVVMTALAKSPDGRYPTARAMKVALLAARASDATTEREPLPSPLVTPTVAAPRAEFARTESVDAHAVPVSLPFRRERADHTPLQDATTSRAHQAAEPTLEPSPAVAPPKADPLPTALAGGAKEAAPSTRPSRTAVVRAFSLAWLGGLLLTVLALTVTKSCGPATAQRSRGGADAERLSSR